MRHSSFQPRRLSISLLSGVKAVHLQKAYKAGYTPGWLCGRVQHLRIELGADNYIRISTDGIGCDISWGCTFIEAATGCDAIDIISVHRYAGHPGQWSGASRDFFGQSDGKPGYLEEWGLDNSQGDIGSAFTPETDDLSSFAMPNTYWQVLPAKDDQCANYDLKNTFGGQVWCLYQRRSRYKKGCVRSIR